MKKILTVYIVGVVFCWFIVENNISRFNKKHGFKTTYGDIAFCSGMSLFSWIGVVGMGIIEISRSKFWSTPINK